MYARLFLFALAVAGAPAMAAAQDAHDGHEGHDAHLAPEEPAAIPATRDGSGTAWLPDESPMYAVHKTVNRWTFMGHGNGFLQYLHESGDRGSEQTGSINWLMGMVERRAGAGRLMLRGMVSLEPWTIGGCGYPDLLATGELCGGEVIHDRQHQHDLFLELGAEYDRPLGRGVHVQLYGAPVGEPALGPVAYMHRVSGMPNALAPMTHHWFDSTHITYGVLTAGLFGTHWKVEGSAFNGREPDEDRTDFDFGAMDSWSARVWYLPTPRWAFQFSGAALNEAEPGHDVGDARVDVHRLTASATYHRGSDGLLWASTLGWGRNAESGEATNALLVEASMALRERHTWFGRFEWAEKSGHDLAVEEHGIFNVAKLQGGYTRYLPPWRNLVAGLGAAASVGLVPADLEPAYGRRVNPGFGVYLTLRPAATSHPAGGHGETHTH